MPIHVISMVPSLQPKDYLERKASPQIQELREALRKFGGEPAFAIFLGDATVYSSKALDPADVGPFDVLVTKHPSIRAYNNATASDAYKMAEQKGKVLVFGFTNNGILVNWVFPALKKIYNMMKLGEDVDLKTKATPQMDHELTQANGDSGLENYKRKVANHPQQMAYTITLNTKNETPDGKRAASDFFKGWLSAAFAHDLNEVLGGSVVSLDKGPKIFGEVSIIQYPTRELFVEFIESDYYKQLQNDRKASTLDRFVEVGVPIY
jgi:uncharacterized protein (DUF1330 family)